MNKVSVFGSRELKDKIKRLNLNELDARLNSLLLVLSTTTLDDRHQHVRKSIENEINIINYEVKKRYKEANKRLVERAAKLNW